MKAFISQAGRPTTCYPLTINRDLEEVPVANHALRELQQETLMEAGYEVVEAMPTEELALYLAPGAWAAPGQLKLLTGGKGPEALYDSRENLVAYLSDNGLPPGGDTFHVTANQALRINYSWDFLELNKMVLDKLTESDILGEVYEGVHVDGEVLVGEDTRILPGVYIEGKVVIGCNCKIGPNCYLRGPTTIGDNCHIGQAVEVKASILMNDVSLGHLSYAGDSIIGAHTNFGAGTITANFRHDGKNHRSMVESRLMDTNRRKLGAIIGDRVHTGIHTSILPGRKLWPGVSTYPGDVVSRDITVGGG